MFVSVCVCLWVQTSASDLQAETLFTPAADFFPDTQKSVTSTFLAFPVSLLLSGFQQSFFPPTFPYLLSFFNFYINLFLTSTLGFRAQIPFPQRHAFSLFITLLRFFDLALSSHTVLFSLFLPFSVSHSPLLWLHLLSFSFYFYLYNFRIMDPVWSWNPECNRM